MPTPPQVELDLRVLTERIRDHGRETQLFLNSVLVTVAVANAAYGDRTGKCHQDEAEAGQHERQP